MSFVIARLARQAVAICDKFLFLFVGDGSPVPPVGSGAHDAPPVRSVGRGLAPAAG